MMKILFKKLFFNILLAQSFLSSATVIQREYVTKDGEIPIYLHYSMRNVDEEIFPREIKIKLSLSRIEGTLLYTIDKKGNQLIVTLYEAPEERMKIEIRGEEYYVTLKELCGCGKCRYKPHELTFGLTDEFINVRCNESRASDGIKWKIKDNKLLNTAYPVLTEDSNYSALLWLVNTPAHGDYFPNNIQLSGCIYEVLYNGKPLNMSIFGDVKDKCERMCHKNVCNSGKCYETFNEEISCDCTDSFMNGKYCNSTGFIVPNHRIKSVNQNFKFKLVKIMWNSNSTEIFYIKNKKTSINISIEEENLLLIYRFQNELNQSLKCIITEKYKRHSNSTMIITFNVNVINIKYFSNEININGEIPSLTNLSEEYFTLMELLNGNGTIDVVYKSTELQYKWVNIELRYSKNSSEIKNIDRQYKRNERKNNWKEMGYKFELLPVDNYRNSNLRDSKPMAFLNNPYEKEKKNLFDWTMIVIIILSVSLFSSFIALSVTIYYKKKQIKQLKSKDLRKIFDLKLSFPI